MAFSLPERQLPNLPFRYVSLILVICLLPAFFLIAGSGFSYFPLHENISGDVWSDHLSSTLAYLFISLLSIVCSLLSVFIATFYYKREDDAIYLVFAGAAFFSSIADLTFISVVAGLFNALDESWSSAFWGISRTINSFVLLAGIWICKRGSTELSRRLSLLLFISFAFLLCFLGFLISSFSAPESLSNGGVLAEALLFIPLLFYTALLFFILPSFMKKKKGAFIHSLYLSVFPAIMMQIHILFGSAEFGDGNYLSAQLLLLFTSLLPLAGLVYPFKLNFESEEELLARQKMEKRFEENKLLLEKVTETIPNGLTIIDIKEFKPVYSNNELLRILGYSKEEIIAMGSSFPEKIFTREGVLEFNSALKALANASGDETLEKDITLLTRNGEEKIIHTLSKAFKRDADGSVRMILTVAEDVTEKKEAEIKLYETNKKFESVFNQTFQLMALISTRGTVEEVNQVALDFSGLESSQVIGKRFWEVPWWPDSNYSEQLKDAVERAIKGDFVRVELILGSEQQPSYLDFSAKPVIDSAGALMFVIAEGRDVTYEKKANEKIVRNEKLYSAMAGNMPDSAVVLLDEELHIQLVEGPIWNAERFPKNELVGSHIRELLQAELFDEYASHYRDAFADKRSEFEIAFDDKFFKVNITPVKNDRAEIFAALAVFHDITNVKKYQHELELRIEELDRSNKDLEQFAYVASHDLQEPLRKIRAFSDRLSLKYKAQLEGDGLMYLDRMENAAGRMQKMIDDLLTFSRVSRSKEPFAKTDMNALANEVIGDLEIIIERKDAEVNIMNQLPEIYAIQSQMRQLFQNIIGNALKFTREGVKPKVTISSRPVSQKEMSLLLVPDPDSKYFEICISDNGIGFDEKYKDRIFTLFQRLHSRAEYEGTGIGLSVCKRIVEYHNGLITVKSEPGKGSSFIFYLPQNQK